MDNSIELQGTTRYLSGSTSAHLCPINPTAVNETGFLSTVSLDNTYPNKLAMLTKDPEPSIALQCY